MTNHLINRSEAKLCHVFPKLSCYEDHEVLDIFRLAYESLSKLRILCCNTHRTGIEITYSHHYTAECYKGCCCKSEFLCTKKTSNSNIPATHELTVCLNLHALPESVLLKSLMCLSKTKLPWKSRIMN